MARSISPFERYGQYRPYTDANLQSHVFTGTETLSGLAHRYYGDWRLWRLIADRNEISDPRRVSPGTILLIPQKPVQRGRYESL
jgi:nucleoid-associated protein YgaU